MIECNTMNCSYNKRDTISTMPVIQIVTDVFCMLLPLRKIAIHHMGKKINISYSTWCLFWIMQRVFSFVLPSLLNNKKTFQQSMRLLTFTWLHFPFGIHHFNIKTWWWRKWERANSEWYCRYCIMYKCQDSVSLSITMKNPSSSHFI